MQDHPLRPSSLPPLCASIREQWEHHCSGPDWKESIYNGVFLSGSLSPLKTLGTQHCPQSYSKRGSRTEFFATWVPAHLIVFREEEKKKTEIYTADQFIHEWYENPAGTSLTQQEAFPLAHTEHTSDIAIYNSNLDVNQGKPQLFRLQLRVLQIVMTESGFSNKFPDIVMVTLFV